MKLYTLTTKRAMAASNVFQTSKTDLKQYFRPLYIINRLTCFWYIDYGTKSSFENLLLYLLSLLVIALFFFCMYRQVLILFDSVNLINSTLFAHHANEMRHIYGFVTIIIICFNNFLKRGKIKESLEEISVYEYKNTNFIGNRQNISTVLIYLIITSLATIVYDCYIFSNYLSHFKFFNYILSAIPNTFHLYYILLYYIILNTIKSMYMKINDFVISINKILNTYDLHGRIKKKIYLMQLMKVCELHYELAKFAQNQNDLYEIPQMLYSSYAFIGFVINYNYLRITMIPIIVEQEDAVPLALNDFLWCVAFSITIYLMVKPWNSVEDEVSSFTY